MPETKEFLYLPEVSLGNTPELSGYVRQIYTPAEHTIPGVVVRGEGVYNFGDKNRAQIVGGGVVRALEHLQVFSGVQRAQGIRPTVLTPHHLDGVDYGGTFAQIHANGPGTRAMMEIEVRRLSPFAQMKLAEQAQGIKDAREYTTQTFLSSMHDSISELAEVVGRYRTFQGLDEGDAVVFRNGFNASQVSQTDDKFLATHSFWSVDGKGNPISETRIPTVDVVQLPVRRPAQPSNEPHRRGSRFGRRRAA